MEVLEKISDAIDWVRSSLRSAFALLFSRFRAGRQGRVRKPPQRQPPGHSPSRITAAAIVVALVAIIFWTPFDQRSLHTIGLGGLAKTTPPTTNLQPPFGFHWNDSMARVEALLASSCARIVSRSAGETAQIWSVEGLIHPGLKITRFFFEQNSLRDVELECQYDGWPFQLYQSTLEELRSYFDAEFRSEQGSVPLISNTGSAPAESRIGYGGKFNGGTLAAFCRSFSSPAPEELSVRDLVIHYSRRDSNFESSPESASRWTDEEISKPIRDKAATPDGIPVDSSFGITEAKLLNTSQRGQTALTLQLAIKLRTNASIDPTKAVVQVYL
jgi:hypothetical protein